MENGAAGFAEFYQRSSTPRWRNHLVNVDDELMRLAGDFVERKIGANNARGACDCCYKRREMGSKNIAVRHISLRDAGGDVGGTVGEYGRPCCSFQLSGGSEERFVERVTARRWIRNDEGGPAFGGGARSYLDTMSVRPGFYRACGYEAFGAIDWLSRRSQASMVYKEL